MSVYTKQEFDGNYLTWYNTIKSQGTVTIPKLDDYSPIESSIAELDWEGNGKNAIIVNIRKLDSKCATLQKKVSCYVTKAKIVYSVLYPELQLLKQKIEAYSKSVDNYTKLQAKQQEYERELVIASNEESSNQNSEV